MACRQSKMRQLRLCSTTARQKPNGDVTLYAVSREITETVREQAVPFMQMCWKNICLVQSKKGCRSFKKLSCVNWTLEKQQRNMTKKIRLTQIEEEIDELLSKVSGASGVLMKYIDEKCRN